MTWGSPVTASRRHGFALLISLALGCVVGSGVGVGCGCGGCSCCMVFVVRDASFVRDAFLKMLEFDRLKAQWHSTWHSFRNAGMQESRHNVNNMEFKAFLVVVPGHRHHVVFLRRCMWTAMDRT